MGAQLIGRRDARSDQVLARTHGSTQGQRLESIGLQRRPAMAIRAQAVSQDVGIAAIGLVAGQAIARAQRLDRPTGDDDHFQISGPQRLDDGAIRALDRHSPNLLLLEVTHQRSQPERGVLDGELIHDLSGGIDNARGVAPGRPIDTAEARCGILHGALPADGSVGEHWVIPGRVCWSLTDRRSLTLSPNASRHVLDHQPSRNSCWPSSGERRRRWSGDHQASADGYVALGSMRVHQ